MKRILIFSLAYYPNQTSGAEAAIKEITDRLDTSDIEFHMVTLRYNSAFAKTEKVGNVLVHRIGITRKNPSFEDLGKMPLDLNKPLYQFLATSQACQLHRKYKYDAIWAMMAHSAGVPAVIFKLTHPKIKYFLTLQEGDPTDYIEKTMRPLWPLFTRAFTKADKVQAISTFLADWAKKRGVPDSKIEIIHNGANPRDLAESASESEIAELKQKLGKKPSDIYLVNTARLVHQKANDDVIRALKLLPDNIKFLIVGDGPDEQMLKDLTKELHLENRVIFTGRIDRSEVTKYRKVADIFVCPSRSEGLGNAFLSAMASHLPVVATQEGGLAEFIFDAKKNPDKETTAWAVDKDSPEQIVSAVKDILANPEKVKRITDTARQMVERKYNWDMIARDMRDKIFAKIL
ncbi:MAG: glycosyltransferase family 4 protein [Patescibacteria group bacterium]